MPLFSRYHLAAKSNEDASIFVLAHHFAYHLWKEAATNRI